MDIFYFSFLFLIITYTSSCLCCVDGSLTDAIRRNTEVLQQTLSMTRKVYHNLQSLSSSFHATPLAIRESKEYILQRPPGRQGRRGIPVGVVNKKASQYLKAWFTTLTDPQNTHFGMDEADGVVTFFHQEQMNATRRVVYKCDCSHLVLSSAFLVYGMCSYDMEAFEKHGQTDGNEIPLPSELSPEDTLVSKYVEPNPYIGVDAVLESRRSLHCLLTGRWFCIQCVYFTSMY